MDNLYKELVNTRFFDDFEKGFISYSDFRNELRKFFNKSLSDDVIDAALRDAGIYHVDNNTELVHHESEIEVINEVILKDKINMILDVLIMKNPQYKSRDEVNIAFLLKHIGVA